MHVFSKNKYLITMLAPVLILYCVFIIIPVFVSVYFSMLDYNGITDGKWVGLANYNILLSKDFVFALAVKNNMIVVALLLLFQLPLSFLVALLLKTSFSGNAVIKAMVFSPQVLGSITVGLIWIYILDPYKGILNSLLEQLSLGGFKQQWIGGTKLTPVSISIISIWQGFGFYATIFLAGMTAIPESLYEAASIDGATRSQTTRYLTLPLLKDTFTIVVMLIITNSFKIFEVLQQLTDGGPAYRSEMLVHYMYVMTFTNSRYGYGMSIAMVTFLISAVFSLIYLLRMDRDNAMGGAKR